MTRIGIIGGTGKEGRGLAIRWARAGHQVVVGSRDVARAERAAAEISRVSGATVAGADNVGCCLMSDVVVLSVPYAGHRETLVQLKAHLRSRTLVDITVPLKPPAVREVHLPPGGAAALEAQVILGSETRVVAALHHVSSALLGDPAAKIDCDILVCSDDDAARREVIDLVKDLGTRGVDAGKLCNAVALESLTPVLLNINKVYKGHAGIRITGLSAGE